MGEEQLVQKWAAEYEQAGACIGDTCLKYCRGLFGILGNCVQGLVNVTGATLKYGLKVCTKVADMFIGMDIEAMQGVRFNSGTSIPSGTPTSSITKTPVATKDLSSGAILGIVLGSAALFLGAGTAIYTAYKCRKKKAETTSSDKGAVKV